MIWDTYGQERYMEPEEQEIKKITREELIRAFEIFHQLYILMSEMIECSDSKEEHRKLGYAPDDRWHVDTFKILPLHLEAFFALVSKYSFDIPTMILNLGDVQVDETTGSIREKYLNGYGEEGAIFKTNFGYDSLLLAAKFAKIFDHSSDFSYGKYFENRFHHNKQRVAVSFNEMVSGLGIDKESLSDKELYDEIRCLFVDYLEEHSNLYQDDQQKKKQYEELMIEKFLS